MSEEEMLSQFPGIALKMEVNTKIPKVTAVRLLISLALNFESTDQVIVLKREKDRETETERE